jgi:hypothetical protein
MDQSSDLSLDIANELDWYTQWLHTDNESVDDNKSNNIVHKELKRLDHCIPRKYRWGHSFVNIVTYFNNYFENRLIVGREVFNDKDDNSTIDDDDDNSDYPRWRYNEIRHQRYYIDENSNTAIYIKPKYGPPGHPVHQPAMCYSSIEGGTLTDFLKQTKGKRRTPKTIIDDLSNYNYQKGKTPLDDDTNPAEYVFYAYRTGLSEHYWECPICGSYQNKHKIPEGECIG